MADKTCAACDCRLDETAVKVSWAGKVVEVCCRECARKLREADTGGDDMASEE
jgi:hypothetical protein